MDSIDLGEFGGGLVALQGFDSHLGFELRLVLALIVSTGVTLRLGAQSLDSCPRSEVHFRLHAPVTRTSEQDRSYCQNGQHL